MTPRDIIAKIPGLPGCELLDVPAGTQIVLGYMAADDVLKALGDAGFDIVKRATPMTGAPSQEPIGGYEIIPPGGYQQIAKVPGAAD